MDEHLISHIEQIGKEEGGGWNRIAYTGCEIRNCDAIITEYRGERKRRMENASRKRETTLSW